MRSTKTNHIVIVHNDDLERIRENRRIDAEIEKQYKEWKKYKRRRRVKRIFGSLEVPKTTAKWWYVSVGSFADIHEKFSKYLFATNVLRQSLMLAVPIHLLFYGIVKFTQWVLQEPYPMPENMIQMLIIMYTISIITGWKQTVRDMTVFRMAVAKYNQRIESENGIYMPLELDEKYRSKIENPTKFEKMAWQQAKRHARITRNKKLKELMGER